MNGLTILSHSFRQVTGNLGMAIKVSGWLVLIYIVGMAFSLIAMPEWLVAAIDQDKQRMMEASDLSAGSAMLVLLVFLAVLVFLLWAVSLVAIVWHRYILLEEVPQGIIPYRKEFHVGRYFWYGIGISLLALIIVSIVGGILGLIVGPFMLDSLENMGSTQDMAAGAFGMAFLIGLVMGVILAVLYLRMALILPAVALGEGLTLGQAWKATSGYTGTILVMAVVLAIVNAIVPMVIGMAFGELVWINLALTALYQWFYFMFGISILSTLYGHIVQKREVY